MAVELLHQRRSILLLGAAVTDRLAQNLELGHERRFGRRVLGRGRVEPRVHLPEERNLFLDDRVWHDEGKGG